MTFPTPGTDWQEVIAPDEAERFERYAVMLQQQQRRRAEKGAPMRRALHSKQLRGVRGEFTVLPDLPEHTPDAPIDLLALEEALQRLESEHPEKAQVVKLRFFAGRSLEDTAQLLGISRATAQRRWAYARAWLFGQLEPS